MLHQLDSVQPYARYVVYLESKTVCSAYGDERYTAPKDFDPLLPEAFPNGQAIYCVPRAVDSGRIQEKARLWER